MSLIETVFREVALAGAEGSTLRELWFWADITTQQYQLTAYAALRDNAPDFVTFYSLKRSKPEVPLPPYEINLEDLAIVSHDVPEFVRNGDGVAAVYDIKEQTQMEPPETLEDALELGGTLVIVAQRIFRVPILCNRMGMPEDMLQPCTYVVLEAMGQLRQYGLPSIGTHSLFSLFKSRGKQMRGQPTDSSKTHKQSSKLAYYVKKKLYRNNLLTIFPCGLIPLSPTLVLRGYADRLPFHALEQALVDRVVSCFIEDKTQLKNIKDACGCENRAMLRQLKIFLARHKDLFEVFDDSSLASTVTLLRTPTKVVVVPDVIELDDFDTEGATFSPIFNKPFHEQVLEHINSGIDNINALSELTGNYYTTRDAVSFLTKAKYIQAERKNVGKKNLLRYIPIAQDVAEPPEAQRCERVLTELRKHVAMPLMAAYHIVNDNPAYRHKMCRRTIRDVFASLIASETVVDTIFDGLRVIHLSSATPDEIQTALMKYKHPSAKENIRHDKVTRSRIKMHEILDYDIDLDWVEKMKRDLPLSYLFGFKPRFAAARMLHCYLYPLVWGREDSTGWFTLVSALGDMPFSVFLSIVPCGYKYPLLEDNLEFYRTQKIKELPRSLRSLLLPHCPPAFFQAMRTLKFFGILADLASDSNLWSKLEFRRLYLNPVGVLRVNDVETVYDFSQTGALARYWTEWVEEVRRAPVPVNKRWAKKMGVEVPVNQEVPFSNIFNQLTNEFKVEESGAVPLDGRPPGDGKGVAGTDSRVNSLHTRFWQIPLTELKAKKPFSVAPTRVRKKLPVAPTPKKRQKLSAIVKAKAATKRRELTKKDKEEPLPGAVKMRARALWRPEEDIWLFNIRVMMLYRTVFRKLVSNVIASGPITLSALHIVSPRSTDKDAATMLRRLNTVHEYYPWMKAKVIHAATALALNNTLGGAGIIERPELTTEEIVDVLHLIDAAVHTPVFWDPINAPLPDTVEDLGPIWPMLQIHSKWRPLWSGDKTQRDINLLCIYITALSACHGKVNLVSLHFMFCHFSVLHIKEAAYLLLRHNVLSKPKFSFNQIQFALKLMINLHISRRSKDSLSQQVLPPALLFPGENTAELSSSDVIAALEAPLHLDAQPPEEYITLVNDVAPIPRPPSLDKKLAARRPTLPLEDDDKDEDITPESLFNGRTSRSLAWFRYSLFNLTQAGKNAMAGPYKTVNMPRRADFSTNDWAIKFDIDFPEVSASTSLIPPILQLSPPSQSTAPEDGASPLLLAVDAAGEEGLTYRQVGDVVEARRLMAEKQLVEVGTVELRLVSLRHASSWLLPRYISDPEGTALPPEADFTLVDSPVATPMRLCYVVPEPWMSPSEDGEAPHAQNLMTSVFAYILGQPATSRANMIKRYPELPPASLLRLLRHFEDISLIEKLKVVSTARKCTLFSPPPSAVSSSPWCDYWDEHNDVFYSVTERGFQRFRAIRGERQLKINLPAS